MAHTLAEYGKGAVVRALFLTPLLLTLGACSDGSSNENAGSASGDESRLNADAAADARAFSEQTYIAERPENGAFSLVENGLAAPLVVSSSDFAGVVRVVSDLRDDIQRVTDTAPTIANSIPGNARQVVIVGTIGKSPLIDSLVSSKKLDIRGVSHAWETFVIQTVDKPMRGIDRALVIAGSDQRGTIYGVYDLSKHIGVSPWYFWDDVPARHAGALYVRSGRYSDGPPAVKYRGFFINDENPQTGNWAPRLFGPGLATIPRAGTDQINSYPGGLNHRYWEKVFEVALRLRANYIWPAVWGRAFADDDPENHATATKYGIVMGTSHEAPMARAIDEWNRRVDPTTRANAGVDETVTHQGKDDFTPSGNGEWRYSTNAESLREYWRQGIKRMVDQKIEAIVTLGMRGPGDVKLPPDTGIPLVNSIITDQRKIISEVTGADASQTPQVWTLYKEVENWWDMGLRAPDDVTVVWCDDNWGNMRELPDLRDAPRAGGYGIYYHFDYVGGGRNYKWLDTNLLPNLWEQLNLSYTYGADRLWMFNVGDLKGNEVPIEFALDMAWNPKRLSLENVPKWERHFAAEQFGAEQASAIADLYSAYAKLQSDRKPELLNRKITLDPNKDPATDASAILYSDQLYFANDANGMLLPPEQRTYYDANPFSLTNYAEFEQVVAEWQELAERAENVGQHLPDEARDAYYELLLYPVKASANLYALRLAEYQNILYAAQQRASANDAASAAEAYFEADQALSNYYNTELAGGKWGGWQTQPHIGYGDRDRYGSNASWQQPQLNELALPDALFPALQTISVPAGAAMGVAIDGSDQAWPGAASKPVLPSFSPYQTQSAQYIEVFNRGTKPFDYHITVTAPPGDSNGNSYALPWIFVTPDSGSIGVGSKQVRALIYVDWPHAPRGVTSVPVTFTVSSTDDATTSVVVQGNVEIPVVPDWAPNRFVEANGVISMDADHYSRAIGAGDIWWKRLADIGRSGSAMTPEPATSATQTPGAASPHLEYDFYAFTPGDAIVSAYLSPRNSVLHNTGLRYGISLDDGAIQTVNINAGDDLTGGGNKAWERHTSDNVNLTKTIHKIASAGSHTLKFWMVDPTVVVQKLVVDSGGQKDSYFGPPESYRTLD